MITAVTTSTTAITIFYSENPNPSQRTGNVTVKNGTTTVGVLIINQAGQELFFKWVDTNTSATTANVRFNITEAPKTFSTNVPVNDLVFEVSDIVTAYTISSKTITAKFTENSNTTDRTGRVTVKYSGEVIGIFNITQKEKERLVTITFRGGKTLEDIPNICQVENYLSYELYGMDLIVCDVASEYHSTDDFVIFGITEIQREVEVRKRIDGVNVKFYYPLTATSFQLTFKLKTDKILGGISGAKCLLSCHMDVPQYYGDLGGIGIEENDETICNLTTNSINFPSSDSFVFYIDSIRIGGNFT